MPLSVGLHWMQFTMPGTISQADTLAELNFCLPGSFEPATTGMLGYELHAVGTGGSHLLASERRPEHHVILPGKWLDSVATIPAMRLLSWITDNKGHLTRLDMAGDDSDKRVRRAALAEMVNQGCLVTHFKTVALHNNILGGKGNTMYVGAASSDRRLRIYDKDYESFGKTDSVRW